MDEKLSEDECLEFGPECDGDVEYRMALSASGESFPRCDHHWDKRLDTEQGIRERYPEHRPSDFDESYAGERWDNDY